MIAICSNFDRFRGFGFAIPADESGLPDDTQSDVFVHARSIINKKYLKRGDLIAYEMGTYKGRQVAINVMVLAPAKKAGE
jgi:cold shock CspA family protein